MKYQEAIETHIIHFEREWARVREMFRTARVVPGWRNRLQALRNSMDGSIGSMVAMKESLVQWTHVCEIVASYEREREIDSLRPLEKIKKRKSKKR